MLQGHPVPGRAAASGTSTAITLGSTSSLATASSTSSLATATPPAALASTAITTAANAAAVAPPTLPTANLRQGAHIRPRTLAVVRTCLPGLRGGRVPAVCAQCELLLEMPARQVLARQGGRQPPVQPVPHRRALHALRHRLRANDRERLRDGGDGLLPRSHQSVPAGDQRRSVHAAHLLPAGRGGLPR